MNIRYMALSDDHLFKGSLISSYKTAIDNEDFAHFFQEHGFGDIDPDQWYPAQAVMDVFSDMEAQAQGFFNFVSIGMEVARTLQIPASVNQASPEDMLSFLAIAQGTLARSSKPGYIRLDCISDTHYRIEFRGAGPDNYFYGILYQSATRFVPASAHIVVKFPPDGRRRDYGDEFTTFDLSWS